MANATLLQLVDRAWAELALSTVPTTVISNSDLAVTQMLNLRSVQVRRKLHSRLRQNWRPFSANGVLTKRVKHVVRLQYTRSRGDQEC